VLDRHGDRNRLCHRLDALGDQFRLGHQAGAERAALHALARAAAIEVDFVVAVLLDQLRAVREVFGLTPAQLHADRMLLPAERQVPLDVAMDQRAGGDHLGVEKGARRHLAQEEPAMPVGPVHHPGPHRAVHCGVE
jgi:hypothetical protein